MCMSRLLNMSIVFALFLFLVGCSDPYSGRMPVSGSVTIKGQPLSEATILFFPLDNQDTSGGAAIAGGKYSIPKQNGLKPGKYLIRITAGDGVTMATPEEAAGPGGSTNIISVDRVPEDWNVKSDHKVDVTAGGPNQFDFAIPDEYVPKTKKK